MAASLKYMYNPEYFDHLCPVLKKCLPAFDCRDFVFRIFNNVWPDLELKERVRHISVVLSHFLSKDFATAATQLTAISQELASANSGAQRFQDIFLADYVQVYGLTHPDESLKALAEITKLISVEYDQALPHPLSGESVGVRIQIDAY